MCSCSGVKLCFVTVEPGESDVAKARRSANDVTSADLSILKNLRGLAKFEQFALEFCPDLPFSRFVADVKANKDFLTFDDVATLKENSIDLVVSAHASLEVRAHSHNANRDGDRCHRRN